MMANIKMAFRKLLNTPFITVIAILSLALGIGANAAIFSIFHDVLMRPLPVSEPGRLVNLEAPGPKPGGSSCNGAGGCDVVLSYPMFRDLQAAEGTGLSGVAGHRLFGANIAQGNQTVDGEGMMVSGSYFPLLGLRPALGRLFQPADDEVIGENPLAVLSHRFWQNNLGGDPGVLNSTIVVNGLSMTVVGVAPRGFDGTTLGAEPDLFVPLSMRGAIRVWGGFVDRRAYWIYAFGRLAPGVSLEQADARLNQVYSSILNEVEAPLQVGMSEQTLAQFREKRLVVEPGERGQSSVREEARNPLLLLLGITGLVLLIACANIANLLLARGANRSTEMAVRGSMGATRGQLVRQLLVEAMMLAVVGGVAGLVVARVTLVGIGALMHMPADEAALLDPHLSPMVLGFTSLVALGTGVLFGLYPAWYATRTDLVSSLKSGTGQAAGSRAAVRFRAGLVTAQIALSMSLLVAAGLFIKSLANISRVDLGLRADNVATFSIAPTLNGYEPERSAVLFERLREELAALPGVEAVTSAVVPVLEGSARATGVAVQGFQGGPDIDNASFYNEVGPGYLSGLGMPLIAGREFDQRDGPDAARVAIVNEAFAEKFGLEPGEVVGSFMAMNAGAGDPLDTEIVGLAQNAKYNSVKEEAPALFFIPHRQDERQGFLSFYVRTAGDPGPILQSIPDVVRRLDPNLPVSNLKKLEQQAVESVFLDRLISMLSTSFAVLATLLAGIGLYGVLAYSVTRRTREIGLRMALGAGTPRVRRLVLRQVAVMFAVGGGVGLAAALALGRAAGSLLYQLDGNDPVVLAASAVLLAAVAFGAGYVPAFRASRVDPMEALRHE